MRFRPTTLLLALAFLLSPLFTWATHIVGGSLTYVHNGGSNYTVTLKLYRDCGPGTAGFPGTVNVVVEGYNGAEFNPSRNISMNLGTVTQVPSNLDPCAIPPNPLPCVEEGIYTTTVNNLPPNPGGYHMYYQIIARNLSIVNINAAGNNIGETFYAYIPGPNTLWAEDFTLADGTTVDNGATAWSVANGATAPNSGEVNNNAFRFEGEDNATATWSSQVINIAGAAGGINASVDLFETGNFENSDVISVSYSLDGGPITQFANNGAQANDFGNVTATQGGLTGNTLQIFVDVLYGGNSPNNERYFIDNVIVSEATVASNSNPEFNLLPPLFLCVNEPFTFDHSATDLDGDSLVYSFYTPYDGDNGAGPLDPTYTNNVANFTPVVFLPGFGTLNPLGGPNLALDANTGLLAGTPTILGQFVLGIKVTEYRNGQYLSETLRDFQFNIVNCPPPNLPIAGNDITVNDGCLDTLTASGFVENTVTWTSVFPGAPGTYDSYLSCTTGCLDPIVTPTGTPPPFVDFVICGTAQACGNAFICDTVRATFNPSLGVTIVPNNPVICFGQTSATLTAVGSGGTPPYSYLWNNVNPSQTNIVGAGTYTVELSDTSGCPPVYATVTVTQFTQPIAVNAGADDTICTQNPIVPINGTVQGATGGIWSGGAGTFSPNDSTLANAFYIPTAAEVANGFVDLFLNSTGNGGCPPDADTVRIFFQGFTGTPGVTTTDVSCFGAADGTATASMTGGVPAFTYDWSTVPPQNGTTATGLDPGSYNVVITDGIGCTDTATVTINQSPPLAGSTAAINVSCNGGNDGEISVTAVGGTAPYTYLWAPGGQTTPTITTQSAGNFDVTVTDANGCIIVLTDSITEPTPIAIAFTPTDASCFGLSDGSAASLVTGGTPPYTYNWAPTGGSAPTATGLAAGTYTLTITDANGCTFNDNVVIDEPPVLTSTVVSTDETCDNLDDGTATVTGAGGTPGYTYLWTPGGMTTNAVNNLATGTYTVVVTDNNGCTSTAFATINEPAPLTLTTSAIDVNCNSGNDGVASVAVSGGTPNYNYAWTPSGGNTDTETGLTAGTYTVVVTDNNGCQETSSVIVNEPVLPISIATTVTDASCNGGTDGDITATPTGGTPPYTYMWLPGGQTTNSISGLNAGNYQVTVTDANGCTENLTITVNEPAPLSIAFATTPTQCFNGTDGTATGTVSGGTPGYFYSWAPSASALPNATGLSAGTHVLTVTDQQGCVFVDSVVVSEPTEMVVSTTTTDETCDYSDDGSAVAAATGGTPGYTYLWQPGNIAGTSITNVGANTYTVTVTDNNGCTTNATAVVNEPAPLNINFVNQVNPNCNTGSNGSVAASPTGGTPNYSYSWMPGGMTSNSINGLTDGTYDLTVTDANGCLTTNSVTIVEPPLIVPVTSTTPVSCNGSSDGSVSVTATGGTGAITFNWNPGNIAGATVNGLPAGTYTVTAMDALGCFQTSTATITQPGPMVLNTSSINSNCGAADGTASVTVASGGTAPFTYSWAPAGGTAATATNLVSGSYTVTVTDNNGCTATATVNVNDNASPTLTISGVTNVSCFGAANGSATVNVAGGAPPFNYLWSPSGQTTATATGLSAGQHTVTVTDNNGCIASVTTNPNITQPPALVVNVSTTDIDCFGGATGSASATVSGGTPPYTYLWMPGGTTGNNVTGLTAGLDSVQVTDANGCTQVVTFLINQPTAALAVAPSATDVSCNGGNDGTVGAVASGGTAPYSYNWMPGNISGANLSGLATGTYTVTVTDNNGCTTTGNVTINEPTALTLTSNSVNSTCGSPNGQASVAAAGGTPPYNYVWSPGGATGPNPTGLAANTYTVTVTDNNGCNTTTTVVVSDTPGPTASVTGSTNVSCFGGSDGTATVNVTGGTAPFTYAWSPTGGTNPTATGLSAGTYSVIVTDANGCQSPVAFSPVITQPNPLVNMVTAVDVNCNGGNDGSASVITFGGTPGYTYTWMPGGSNGNTVAGLTAGPDSVMVTDANGCTETTVFNINQPTTLTANINSSTNVSCFGGNNGAATVTVTGGTPVYTYSWAPFGGNGPTANGLTAGTYTVTITDGNGCTTTANVNITEPAAVLAATSAVTDVNCFGASTGSATINATGGTAPYNYTWSPTGAGQTTNNLAQGNYTVLVADANGCQTNVAFTITEPSPISTTLLVTNPSCGLANGAIVTNVTGGVAPYAYAWAPGGGNTPFISGLLPGNYFVDITDANGCVSSLTTTLTNTPGPSVTATAVDISCFGGADGSATANISGGTAPYNITWSPYGGNGLTANGLTAGVYTVNVVDGLGCTDFATIPVGQPTPITVSIASISTVTCNGGNDGTVTVNATGGTGPYTYDWAPILSTSQTVTGLAAGVYSVTATDANGCTGVLSVTMTEPTNLFSSIGLSTNPTCFGVANGSATVVATGGTIPYSYLWTDGQTGATAFNLGAGMISVTVTDSNGCTTSSDVTLVEPPQIVTVAGPNDTICLGDQATLTATASGGVGNFSFAWQPGGQVTGGVIQPSPTADTDYIVIAYDQNGCPGTPDTTAVIVYSLDASNVLTTASLSPICPGQSSDILCTVTGTNPDDQLTYTWNQGLPNGPGPHTVTPAAPTTYVVTVTNSCGVSVQDSVSVIFNPPPILNISASADSACAPAAITFTDSSVTGNFTDQIHNWFWDFGDGNTSQLQDPTHVYTTSGTFDVTLTVVTGNGCTSNNLGTPIQVTIFPFPEADFDVASTTLDLPYDLLITENQSINATSYLWSFGDGSTSTDDEPTHMYGAVGTYNVELVAYNDFNCSDTARIEVITTADLVFPNAFTPNPDGSSGGYYDIASLTNDIFFPYTSGVVEYELQIFNRWGELVFETNDVFQGWDGYYRGELSAQGVYVWKVNAQLNDGRTISKIGDVTLLR